jgi:biotin carboxyl carrier protein
MSVLQKHLQKLRMMGRDDVAEIKITTEVAGRVCELLLSAGEPVADGDDIALVEAMKIEIPVAATTSGTINRFWSRSTIWSRKGRPSL